MFKQAHSAKYKEICKYNRSFKTLKGLGWVNLKECALSIHKKRERVQPSCFILDWRCHVHAIKISFSPDSSLSSATDCHSGQKVKEFYEILARFYYHFITHPSNRRRNPKFQIILLLSMKQSYRHFLLLTLSFTAILIQVGEKNVKSAIMKSNLR